MIMGMKTPRHLWGRGTRSANWNQRLLYDWQVCMSRITRVLIRAKPPEKDPWKESRNIWSGDSMN